MNLPFAAWLVDFDLNPSSLIFSLKNSETFSLVSPFSSWLKCFKDRLTSVILELFVRYFVTRLHAKLHSSILTVEI